MMSNMKKFIVTNDEETKNILLDLGYSMLNSLNGNFIFKNNVESTQLFQDRPLGLDKSKLTFTNKLFFKVGE
jgi:hypothetical protein